MKQSKDIVVTGMGVVSCLGHEVDEFHRNLAAGKSGVSLITEFPCEDYSTRFAGVIHEFDPSDYLDKKHARRADKFIAYGVAAGKKALTHAGLDQTSLDKIQKKRVGVIIGSGMGGMHTFSDGVQNLIENGVKRVSPFFVPYTITNMAGALLAIEYGFMGPNYSISTACATGNYAIISAANHLRNGDADLIICGGVEAPIIPMGLAGFCSCKALSTRNEEPTRASRPWDQDRDGFVLGEGAGVIVLETRAHAEARGAPILARYLGGAFTCDAYNMTAPHPDGEGVADCIRLALADAHIGEKQVDYINAHGTSTPTGDMAEVLAMKRIFSDPAARILTSTKSMIGHSLGAAAGIEAVATIKTLQEGVVHPTINLDHPEPDLEFHVPKQAEERKIQVGISNSFGFGGHNATVVFGSAA